MSIKEIIRTLSDQMALIYSSSRKLGFARGGAIISNNENYILRMKEFIPLYEPRRMPDGKKVRGYYFDYSRIYRNKPDEVTFQKKRTWQFNNLGPREYK